MRVILKQVRLRQSVSIAELARRSGVTCSAIYCISNGSEIPRLDTAYRLAKALGVALDDLVTPESRFCIEEREISTKK